MGAMNFHSAIDQGSMTIIEAFDELVERVAWEHGHGGYTGTLAEKNSFAYYEFAPGLGADEIIRAIENADGAEYIDGGDGGVALKALVNVMKHGTEAKAKALINTYSDKWGPAIGFETEGEYNFTGWASS